MFQWNLIYNQSLVLPDSYLPNDFHCVDYAKYEYTKLERRNQFFPLLSIKNSDQFGLTLVATFRSYSAEIHMAHGPLDKWGVILIIISWNYWLVFA